MLKVKDNKLNYDYEYNSTLDLLYINIDYSDDSYGDEENRGIVLNYDFKTDKLVSIDIWDFEYRIENNKPIPLPITVDLQSIYNSL
jgi:hypothetical protein